MTQRIAMVAYTHYTTDARPRRAAEALVGRGDSIDFFALAEADRPLDETLNGVELHRLDLPRYRGGNALQYLRSYLGFFARALLRVTAQHARKRYDVVYVHTMPDAMAFCGAFAKLAGARLVLDVHDTMPELYQSKFGLGGTHPLIRALAVQEQLSCRFADRVICVNEPHRDLLVSRGLICMQKVTGNGSTTCSIRRPSAATAVRLQPRPTRCRRADRIHGTAAVRWASICNNHCIRRSGEGFSDGALRHLRQR